MIVYVLVRMFNFYPPVWNNTPSSFGTVHFQFRNIKMKALSWLVNSVEPVSEWLSSILVANAYQFLSSAKMLTHLFFKEMI